MTALEDFQDLAGDLDGADTTTLAALTVLLDRYIAEQTAENAAGVTALNELVGSVSLTAVNEATTTAVISDLVDAWTAARAVTTTQARPPNLTWLNRRLQEVVRDYEAATRDATRVVSRSSR
jgi:hypothetical protein